MRSHKVVAFLLAAFSIPQIGHAGIIWDTNGHEYELVNLEGSTWLGAEAALGEGWHLATVTSLEENDFIVGSLLAGLTGTLAERSHYWIGGTDSDLEGSFSWVTGEEFGYTNWFGGEANNLFNEDFLAYDLRGTSWGWNDAPNELGTIYGFSRGYIMERGTALSLTEPVSVPEPTSLLLFATGLLGTVAVARRKRA